MSHTETGDRASKAVWHADGGVAVGGDGGGDDGGRGGDGGGGQGFQFGSFDRSLLSGGEAAAAAAPPVVSRLQAENAQLQAALQGLQVENRMLREEIARLTGHEGE